MTIPQSYKAVKALARRHTEEIAEAFSPDVAVCMLGALNAGTDALLQQLREGRDCRDVVIMLGRQLMEADNLSKILAKETSETILGRK